LGDAPHFASASRARLVVTAIDAKTVLEITERAIGLPMVA
jgi:hypothetical protein